MRHFVTAVLVCGLCAVFAPAQAQYYPPGYYDYRYPPPPPPPRRYRAPPPGYYYGPPAYGAPYGAPARVAPGDPGYQPWRPRVDPRNGGLYCVQQGYTVQDGVCKPGRY